MAKGKLIELTNGTVYLARIELDTASENPLTDRELVIIDLDKQIQVLKNKL